MSFMLPLGEICDVNIFFLLSKVELKWTIVGSSVGHQFT